MNRLCLIWIIQRLTEACLPPGVGTPMEQYQFQQLPEDLISALQGERLTGYF